MQHAARTLGQGAAQEEIAVDGQQIIDSAANGVCEGEVIVKHGAVVEAYSAAGAKRTCTGARRHVAASSDADWSCNSPGAAEGSTVDLYRTRAAARAGSEISV